MQPIFFVDLDDTLIHSILITPGVLEAQQAHLLRYEKMQAPNALQARIQANLKARVKVMTEAPIAVLDPERYLVLVRPGTVGFLQGLGLIGDVVILSAGHSDYVREVLRVTGLLPLVQGAHSTRTNPRFGIQDRPWFLIDDMNWGSIGVTTKVQQISGGEGTRDHFIQIKAYSGVPDEELGYTLDKILGILSEGHI